MRYDSRWILLALGLAAACGAKQTPPPQRPEPTTDMEADTKATGAPTPHATSAGPQREVEEAPAMEAPSPMTESAPPPAARAPVSVEAPSAGDPHARYMRANVQLAEAKQKLDVAAGQRDCGNACRALDSMERAMTELCELARSSEERSTCKSAEDQVSSARERVRKACGECPKKGR